MTELVDDLIEEEENIGAVYVLKLVTGESIIADVDTTMDYVSEVNRVTLMFPAKIVDAIDSKGYEVSVLKSWMPYTVSHGMVIETKHILFIDHATNEILEKYTEFVMDIQEQLALSHGLGDDVGESKKALH